MMVKVQVFKIIHTVCKIVTNVEDYSLNIYFRQYSESKNCFRTYNSKITLGTSTKANEVQDDRGLNINPVLVYLTY